MNQAVRREALTVAGLFAALLGLGAAAGPARAVGGAVERPRTPARAAADLIAFTAGAGRHPFADEDGTVALLARVPVGSAASRGLRELAPGVGAVRLHPSEVAAFAAAHPDLPLFASPPRRPLLDKSNLWNKSSKFRDATGVDGAGAIVGVIDTSFDLAHPDLRNADGTTRVEWLLRRGSPRGLHPEIEAELGCVEEDRCFVLSKDDIDDLLAAGGDDPALWDFNGHGTHVASIAAGNGGPSVTTPKYVGAAPGARLVLAGLSETGAFFDDDILRAARFVFDRADELGLPVALNMSVGGDFGAHDGSSPVEIGLSELVGPEHPGRAIVVASGNSATLWSVSGNPAEGDTPYGIHADVWIPGNVEVGVPLFTPPSKSGTGYVWVTFPPGARVDVGLRGPDGKPWMTPIAPGRNVGRTVYGQTTCGVINDAPGGGVSLDQTTGAVVTFQGEWKEGEFQIVLRAEEDTYAALWVTGTGDVSLDTSTGLLFPRATGQGTTAVPATAPELLAVGCTLNRLGWAPIDGPPIELGTVGGVEAPKLDSPCYFSGWGPTPTGAAKPDLVAPGGFVGAAMAYDADPRITPGSLFDVGGCLSPEDHCYVLDDWHGITAGTSMSAPQVAGAAALLLAAKPSLTQPEIRDLLVAGARAPQGDVPIAAQVGPGALDLEGTRQALGAGAGKVVSADAAASWFTLSSTWARPDPAYPVTGVVQLRHQGGVLALGVKEEELELVVTGGVVAQALEPQAGGTWRFAVAAEAGATGDLQVEVRHAGASLGVQTLPIRRDPYDTFAGLELGGGCAAGGRGSAWLALLALALAGARQRRTRR